MDCNYEAIVELLDPDHDLLQHLLAAHCISDVQKSDIESADSTYERSRRVIECLRQKDEFYLISLVDGLKRTKQQGLVSACLQSAGMLLLCLHVL